MTRHFNRTSERDKRKQLRGNSTDAEQRLWRRLRNAQLGVKFRRQYSVDVYVVDFYGPQAKLAIEVDGDSHFSAQGMAYDRERTAYLNGFGIEVMRFTNLEVVENLDAVVEAIVAALVRKKPPPDPLLASVDRADHCWRSIKSAIRRRSLAGC